jgi:hypothetical protein
MPISNKPFSSPLRMTQSSSLKSGLNRRLSFSVPGKYINLCAFCTGAWIQSDIVCKTKNPYRNAIVPMRKKEGNQFVGSSEDALCLGLMSKA